MAKSIVPSLVSLQKSCLNALRDNFTPAEASKAFHVDRSNMCAYYRGSKSIPLGLMFEILDYIGIQVVCFKRY